VLANRSSSTTRIYTVLLFFPFLIKYIWGDFGRPQGMSMPSPPETELP
jgi:hypothetical protein